jgi:phosphatidylglycerophosphatase A
MAQALRSKCRSRATIISPDGGGRPDARFLLAHPAHFVALGAGAGLVPRAPGTAGTLLAFPLYWLFAHLFSAVALSLAIAVLFAIGVWACTVTGRALGRADHPSMVWDEVVAFLLVLVLTPDHGYWPLFAFALFRLFDIAKPPPIRYYERALEGGFGVMFDDVLAALYTVAAVTAAGALVQWWRA